MTTSDRLKDLRQAEKDYTYAVSRTSGEKRLLMVQRLTRIQRQIKMLTEADRGAA